MNICKDCDGRGYNISDPDGRPLVCQACDGWGEIIDDDELTKEAEEIMGREPREEPDEDALTDESRERKTGK